MSEPEWEEACKLSALENGERVFHDFEYETAVIMKVDDAIYAIEDRCTHDDGPLGDGKLEGCQLVCPRHGARFDVTTGKALTLPAVGAVSTYLTRVEDDIVFIAVPE